MLAGARAAGGPADSARVMMVMMQVKITDGGETRAAAGPAARARVMMMVVLIKIRTAQTSRNARLGAARVMTVMMVSTRVASGTVDSARVMIMMMSEIAASSAAGSTRVVMMMLRIKIADGGETRPLDGHIARARALSVVMMIKIRRARPASLSATQTKAFIASPAA
jgi:hypothetical protein